MTERKNTQTTRCVDTVDIEELLEWMLLNPESYPDNQWLDEKEESDVEED